MVMMMTGPMQVGPARLSSMLMESRGSPENVQVGFIGSRDAELWNNTLGDRSLHFDWTRPLRF